MTVAPYRPDKRYVPLFLPAILPTLPFDHKPRPPVQHNVQSRLKQHLPPVNFYSSSFTTSPRVPSRWAVDLRPNERWRLPIHLQGTAIFCPALPHLALPYPARPVLSYPVLSYRPDPFLFSAALRFDALQYPPGCVSSSYAP
ncbi:hypothetical protein CH63R_04817 [Colletotrichum higginsianum IMI 349063]|uniref:Uncharacterized protein n=1 Tax=Colletotrichum higginsianum (strain IMI 349063) TaxID=759273 RepID=A0A1B7YKC8_COLHI|nr:hypothetical protein CH63R_04817 [Colletotrichum higginsianum IMI 349063]OBR12521.1 hypothetical protein CH63R_04817 [Colletotrichum higginsianum IMI 349063]